MKAIMCKPVNVEFDKIEIMAFIRHYDDSSWEDINSENDWMPCKKDGSDLPGSADDYFRIVIDIESGSIYNWPNDNKRYHVFSKVCDEFYALIRDKNTGDIILNYEGYVPSFMAIENEGYGDYVDFIIENGKIRNWSFNIEHFNKMLKNNFDN